MQRNNGGKMSNKLMSEDAIKRIKLFAEDESIGWVDVHGDIWNLLAAYADIMRENEALLKHPPLLVCEKCRHINTIHPYKDTADDA